MGNSALAFLDPKRQSRRKTTTSQPVSRSVSQSVMDNERQQLDQVINWNTMAEPYLKGMDEIREFTEIFPDPNKERGSWKKSFKKLLNHFAQCLHDNCSCSEGVGEWFMRQNGRSWPFLMPFKVKCMLIDWEKVERESIKYNYLLFKSHKGYNSRNKRRRLPPYLEAKLGKGERHPPPRSRCKEIIISAHRVLCFWRHGHPPAEKGLVLHTCGQSHCLNPLHLKWGDAKENSYHSQSAGRGTEINGNDRGSTTNR